MDPAGGSGDAGPSRESRETGLSADARNREVFVRLVRERRPARERQVRRAEGDEPPPATMRFWFQAILLGKLGVTGR